jgi:agmatinase
MSYKDLYLQDAGKILKLVDSNKPKGMVFGVPFDSTSSYRVGSKWAPQAIRSAFNNIEIYSKLFDVNLEKEFIDDLGDMSGLCVARSVSEQIFKLWKELLEYNIPICMLGGEHSISYGSISAIPNEVGVIIFDAHLDLRDELDGLDFSHATFFRRLLDKLDKKRFIHFGSRAACEQEWIYVKDMRLNVIEMDDFNIDSIQKNQIFKDYNNFYVSVDMDVFDPAYAPGIGNPEPNGISPKDFFKFLRTLKGKKIIGFDIVEVCPPYDNGNTSVLAAKIMLELFSYCFSTK